MRVTVGLPPSLAFALAETLSISGTRLSTIAIPWLVLTTTGSPVLTGVVAMAEMLPYVVAKALSGPLIDRIGPKRLAIGCDLASVLVVGLVPATGRSLGGLGFELLLPHRRRHGDAARAVRRRQARHGARHRQARCRPLERVTGVAGVIERLASTVGAAAAGGLIALIGPGLALALNTSPPSRWPRGRCNRHPGIPHRTARIRGPRTSASCARDRFHPPRRAAGRHRHHDLDHQPARRRLFRCAAAGLDAERGLRCCAARPALCRDVSGVDRRRRYRHGDRRAPAAAHRLHPGIP